MGSVYGGSLGRKWPNTLADVPDGQKPQAAWNASRTPEAGDYSCGPVAPMDANARRENSGAMPASSGYLGAHG